MKKIAKKREKKYTGPPPHEQIFFLWGTKGKESSFGAPNEKKILWGTKENKNFLFLSP